MKIDEEYFKKVFNISVGITPEDTLKAVKTLQLNYDLLNEEAKEYFDLLIKENELDPDLEK
jgi:hypothetical protein